MYKREPNILERLIIGYLSALQGTITTIPLDVVFTIRRVKTKKVTGTKQSFLQVFQEFVKSQGFLAFYQGWQVSMVLCLNPAITYVVFDKIKLAWVGSVRSLTAVEAFVVGALSKAIATVLTFPFIRSKAILNTWVKIHGEDSTPPSLMQALMDIINQEGLAGLFVGIYPQLTKGVLNAALMLMLKEKVDEAVEKAFALK